MRLAKCIHNGVPKVWGFQNIVDQCHSWVVGIRQRVIGSKIIFVVLVIQRAIPELVQNR